MNPEKIYAPFASRHMAEDVMAAYQGKSNFYRWLGASLALHAALVLPFMLFGLRPPAQFDRAKLRIELFGMVADRQLEEKKIQQKTPPRRQVVRPQIPDTYKTAMAESPVKVAKREEEPKPVEHQPAPAPPIVASTETVQQRQQTIRPAENETEKTRRYLGRLTKQLRGNLVYPEMVRRHGVEGITMIAFVVMENGHIKEGTLRVIKSSGYAALDTNALQAARVSAPFEKPPKELSVATGVSFSVKMARQAFAASHPVALL